MKLIEGFDSNYRYILVAARRARQLQSGAPPVVDTNSRKLALTASLALGLAPPSKPERLSTRPWARTRGIVRFLIGNG